MKSKLLCLAFLCLLLPAFAHEGHQNQAVQIAEMKPTNIEIDDTRVSNMHIISSPGASFVKVHFDYFNLPEDAYVVVRNPQGSEVYTYGMTNRDEYTFDPELQEDGWSSFASMSITGQTAIVSLYHEREFSWEDGYAVYVSRYMEGYSNERIQELTGQVLYDDGTVGKSTCGNMQRIDVECYKNSHPTEYERAKSVARLLMGGGLCTAWRVGDDNRMMTNEHCMATSSAVTGSESWFNYQNSSCNGSSTTTPTKVSGASLLASDYDLDYTLYTVNNFSSIQGFGNLGLDVRTPVLHEEIYIPQHGSGNPKELSIEDDQNSTGICRIDDAIANGRATNSDTGYKCDTIGGSSGSPVLARSSNKVIALHHLGGCNNQGVRIDRIWPQISNHFGGVIPDGSAGGGVGPTPFYRFYKSSVVDHFYSTDFNELGSAQGYKYEKIEGYIYQTQVPNTIPIYRYYSPSNPNHFYVREWKGYTFGAYQFQKIAGYTYRKKVAGTTPLYRYYHMTRNNHFYTTNYNELGGGNAYYRYEGILCYVRTKK